jgi:hypothetical protein
MFQFPDKKSLDRLELLDAVTDAKEYWTFLYHLKKVWTAFGNRALELAGVYRPFVVEMSNVRLISEISDLSEVKLETIREQIKLTDQWIAEALSILQPETFKGSQSLDGEEFDGEL